MENVENYLKALKDMGGNWTVITWNASLVNDEDYINKLTKTIRWAKERYGFRLMLNLSDMGFKDPNDPFSGEQIQVVDEQIPAYWKDLLDNPDVAFWAGKDVDIFNLISEPTRDSDGSRSSVNDPDLREACLNEIRRLINNGNAICGYSGSGKIGWAGDATELIGQEWEEWESTVGVHPYKMGSPESDRPDIRGYIKLLQAQGINVHIGEIGWRDWDMSPIYMKEILRYFEENKISYLVHGLTGGYNPNLSPPNGEFFLDWQGQKFSPVGEQVKDLWSQYKDIK